MSKVSAKKKMVAEKMSAKRAPVKAVIEGDYQELGPQDRFNKKDVKKTIASRKERNGKLPSKSWEI